MSTAFQWTCGSCTYQNVVPDRTKSVVQCKMCGQTSQLQFGPPPATPPAPLPTPPVQPPRPTPTPTPAPKSEPKKQDPWTCTVCTYQNTLSNIKACVMCQAPRASVTPPSQPTPTPTPPPVATPPMYGVPGGVSPPGGFGFPQPTPTPQPQPTPQPTYPAGGYPTPQPVVGQPPVAASYQPYVVGYDAQGRPIMSQPPVATTPPQPQPQPVPTPQPTPTPTPQPTPTPPVQPGLPPGMMTIAHADGRLMMVPAPPGHPQHIPQVYAPYAQALGYPVPPTVGAGLPGAQPQPPVPTPTPTPTPTPQSTYGVPPTAAGGVILTGGPAGSPPAGYPGYPQPTPQPTPQPVVGNGQGASPYLMDPSLVGGFAPVGGVVSPPAQPQPVPTPAVSPPSSSFGAPHGSPTVNPQSSPISIGGDFGVDGKRGVPSPSGSSAPFSLEGMGLPASHAAMRPAVAPTPTPAPTPSPAQSAADAFAGSAAAALRDINHQGPPVALTPEQKKLFVRQGYVVIPGVVPKSRVQAALRAINHDMGKGVSRDDAIKAKATTWCPSLMPMPVITNLFNASNAIQLVSSVLGQPCPAVTAGQIALRHPGTLCTDPVTFTPVPWWDKGWHIDGFHSKDNGIPKGSIRNFTCLVGVLLNDIPSEMSGNLAVYPRSHLVLQDYFRTNGFEKVKEGLDSLPRLPLSKPVQITGNAGDLVICHYQLAHTIAPNVSPNIRYAAYFRITSPSMKTQSLPPVPDVLKDGADAHRPESMLNIWKDWPGLAPYLDAEGEREGISEIKDGEGGQRPFYGDEVARVEDEKAAEEDRRRAVVQEQADKLFEAHKWLECQSIWTQLAQEQPHDYVIQFKAGCVHTWSPREDAETLRQGEDFLQKAATLCPVYPNVYAVLAHNRLRQGRHKEAVAAVKQMLACPYKEGEDRTIVDALKHARDSLVKLDQVNQLDGMLKQARTTYPHLGAQFDEIMVGVEGEQTWVQCKAWLDSPTKSFPHGEALFRKLVSLKPTDYWANWLLGGVLTWEGKREKCIQGQPFIAEALTINPALPHGYQLMAQNLMIQGKPQEAVAQVQAMLAQPLEDIATNDGHAQKIIEALNTVFKVLGKSSPEFQSLLTTAQSSYPSLLPRLAQFQ